MNSEPLNNLVSKAFLVQGNYSEGIGSRLNAVKLNTSIRTVLFKLSSEMTNSRVDWLAGNKFKTDAVPFNQWAVVDKHQIKGYVCGVGNK